MPMPIVGIFYLNFTYRYYLIDFYTNSRHILLCRGHLGSYKRKLAIWDGHPRGH